MFIRCPCTIRKDHSQHYTYTRLGESDLYYSSRAVFFFFLYSLEKKCTRATLQDYSISIDSAIGHSRGARASLHEDMSGFNLGEDQSDDDENDYDPATLVDARCAFVDRNLRSRMPLDPTPTRV
jgi:hypothetical protein